MITYESLRELAKSLSRVTGYRYIAFCDSYKGDLLIYLSDSIIRWYSSRQGGPSGFWICDSYYLELKVKDLPYLDWYACQFDCEEE